MLDGGAPFYTTSVNFTSTWYIHDSSLDTRLLMVNLWQLVQLSHNFTGIELAF